MEDTTLGVLQSPFYAFFLTEKIFEIFCFPFVSRSSGVCPATRLQEAEKAAVHKRSPKVLEALRKLNIQADQVSASEGHTGGIACAVQLNSSGLSREGHVNRCRLTLLEQ